MQILTPCIKKCRLFDGVCVSCKRTIDDIVNWSKYDDNTKLNIIDKLKGL